MAKLPIDAIQRIAQARRDAESALKKDISALPETDQVAPYLPAVTRFACTQFDAEAGELLAVCEDADAFQTAMEEVASRIVEGILPDQSLERVTAQEMAQQTGEVKRLSIDAPHGDWEHFMPKGFRFQLRWRNNKATVRTALSQPLQNQAVYWAGRFQPRLPALLRPEPDPAPSPAPPNMQVALEPAADTSPEPGRKQRRHGFLPYMDGHRRIAEIVEKHAPDWRTNNHHWRSKPVLRVICQGLDEAKIETPESWKKGEKGGPQALKGAAVETWVDAHDLAETGNKLVADQIRTSLGAVRKSEKGK